MARAALISTSFANGEISPLIYGRPDLSQYQNSVRQLENFIVTPQGAITRRPGTYFVNEVKDSSKVTRLIGFQFSTIQSYVLEFGHNYIRFFKDNGAVLETAKNITGATAANPCVITSNGHGFANGDSVYITGVTGMTELNGRFFTVANQAANTFELSGVNSTAYTAYAAGGTVSRVYTLTTTYASTDVMALNVTQSADTMYIVHPSFHPKKLTRTAHTSWTIADVAFTDGPYLSENVSTVTMSPSAAGTVGSDITMTASSATFVAGDVGRFIYVKNAVDDGDGDDKDDRGIGTIKTVTSSTAAEVTVKRVFKTGAKEEWALGAFYAGNYPSTVTFYEQRLWYANTPTNPQTVWASVSGQYDAFGGTESMTLDTDGLNYSIASDQVNAIRWMMGQKVLLCGTAGDEFSVSASSLNEAITPTNIKITSESSEGSSSVQPVKVGSSVLYLQSTQRRVMDSSYSFDVDRYISNDLTVFSEHIAYPSVTALAYQRQPYRVVWAVRSDGVLLGCTYYKDQKVLGWHRHIIGGTAAKVKSICTIQGTNEDQLWMIVSRTIGGATKQYVEYMGEQFRNKTVDEAHFVDSGLRYSGAAADDISGLIHLAGETVSINAEGAAHPDQVVTALGHITLNDDYTSASIGLGYTSVIETNNLEGGAAQGTSQTAITRIHELGIRFYETVGAKYGPDEANLTPIPFRSSAIGMNDPIPLFTGDKVIKFTGGYTREPRVVITQEQPLPMTISCMIFRCTVAEI